VSTRSIAPERYAVRLARAQAALPAEDIRAIDRRRTQWLTGWRQELERPTMLVVLPTAAPR
jgi:hypothetical protein